MPDLSGKELHQGLGLFDADWRATSSSTLSRGCPKRSLTQRNQHIQQHPVLHQGITVG